MFFVDGPGGTGNTFLFNTIARKGELLGFHSVMTAYTGLAGKNMPQNVRSFNNTTRKIFNEHSVTAVC